MYTARGRELHYLRKPENIHGRTRNMTEYTAKKARELRLAATATPEELEGRFSGMDGKTITFGDYTIIAGYHYNGKGEDSYFWAAYLFTDKNKKTCEDEASLQAVGNGFHKDDGHAIADAFNWASQWG